jgi:hypothetical protein
MNNSHENYICPHCEKKYRLGINGTVEGCDVCLSIIRNPLDNTIIETINEEEDALTDMEKA